MMAKAIVWVRVSTNQQDIEDQRRECYQMANADGWTNDNIIELGAKGASARMHNKAMSAEYINQLNKLLDYIKNDPDVKALYIWELSRLARVYMYLINVVEYCKINGVQFVCKNPNIRLLDANGNVDNNADITITVVGKLAAQEMDIKIARMKRGKNANTEKGLATGNKRMYGYDIVNKQYVINEAEADIIRTVYRTYLDCKGGYNDTVNELNRIGINLNRYQVIYILQKEAYTGSMKLKSGLIKPYPQIITKELFEKVKQKREGRDIIKDKSRKYYLCTFMLKCPICGAMLKTMNGKSYRCGKCQKLYAPMYAADTILWDVATKTRADILAGDAKKIKADIEATNEELMLEIKGLELSKEKTNRKLKARQRLFLDGEITETEYDEGKLKIEAERATINTQIEAINDRIHANNKRMTTITENDADTLQLYERLHISEEMDLTTTNWREMYDIIRTYIKVGNCSYVRLKKLNSDWLMVEGDNERYRALRIDVEAINNRIYTYFYLSPKGNQKDLRKPKYLYLSDDGLVKPMRFYVEIPKRMPIT